MASKLSVFLILVVLVTCASAQTMITDCTGLQNMNLDLAGSYALANDIACSVTSSWNSGAGFEPVGSQTTPFTGTLDGQGYQITNLVINRPTASHVGLFGTTSKTALIYSVGLVAADISGSRVVGGLVGSHSGTIRTGYFMGSVTGSSDTIGGLVGHNYHVVSTSYAVGNLVGSAGMGGLVSYNTGIISNSYSNVQVPNSGGGLVDQNTGSITNSYAAGLVLTSGAGLIRSGNGVVSNSCWDTQTSGQASSVGAGGVIGKTTAEMYQQATFKGWDFDCVWSIDEGNAYPQLTHADCRNRSVVVSTCVELQAAMSVTDAIITLSQDIDCSDTVNWNSGEGFLPGTALALGGRLEGSGFQILNLFINRPTTNGVGLFSTIGPEADVQALGVTNVDISGNDFVGGLVGYNLGNLISNYATGNIAAHYYAGGLLGWNQGVVSTSYATSNVLASFVVGALVGSNRGSGILVNSYATGNATSLGNYAGGLVGNNGGIINNAYAIGTAIGSSYVEGLVGNNDAVVSNGYWDTQTSGQATSAEGGVTGKTTTEMYQQATFKGWDFDCIWSIDEGNAYPQLTHADCRNRSIVVSTCTELQAAISVADATIILSQDIDCSDTINWNSGAGFLPGVALAAEGKMNGNGFHILNLFINRPTTNGVGLFASIGPQAHIQAVGLTNAQISGGKFVGALVGLNYLGSVATSYAMANVTSLGAPDNGSGGLVGRNLGGTIVDSSFLGKMSGAGNAGGLTGYSSGTIINCYVSADIASTSNVGALVGVNVGTVLASYANGSVTGTSGSIGGLVGTNSAPGSISKSYALVEVSGSANYIGGLVGNNPQGTLITTSYAAGSVTGSGSVGGLAGGNAGSIISSYWDRQASGQISSIGGTGKTTSEMYQKSTFVGWDFINDWWVHQDYPRLRASSFPPVQVVNPIADKSYPIGLPFSFSFPTNTMEDPSDANLDYTAQLPGGSALPGWLTFTTSTRTFSGTPPLGTLGSSEIEVIATNDDAYGESEVFTLTITNCAPTQDNALMDQTVAVGEALNYAFAANTFSDCEGHALSYAAQQSGGGLLPSWLSFTDGTRTFSGTPVSGNQGSVLTEVTADDGFGGSVVGSFTLTISNQVPTVQTPIATQEAANGELFEFFVPSGTFDDADGDDLTLSTILSDGSPLPSWLIFFPSTTMFSGTPTARATYQLVIIAVDDFGGAVNTTFEIIVPNAEPILVGSIDSQVASINSLFSFTFPAGLFSDSDGDALQYTAQQSGASSLPSWLSFDGAQRLFSGTPTAEEKGTLEIELIADDDFGGQATAAFILTVPSGGSSKLSDGEIAAIALSITGSVAGLFYTGYKFYKKRQFYKGESTKGKSEHGAEMTPR